jgi:hypothetical protein
MWFGAFAPEGEIPQFLTPWFFAIQAIVTVRQCCGSALVSMRIRIRIQGFDDQKLEKNLQL